MVSTILGLALGLFAVDPSWKNDISRDGWIELRDSADVVLFLKRSGAPSSFWIRSEMEDRSAMVLMRYDCSAWTIQIAQSFSYSEPNMIGDTTASSTLSTADVPPPNSLLDTLLTTVCTA